MTVKKSLFNLKNQLIWFVPAVAVTLGIFALSTFLSAPIQVEGVSFLDKIEHCFAYFVLALSFLVAFKKSGKMSSSTMWRIVLLSSLYGFSLELVQYLFFARRFFDWYDALANILGVLVGFGLFKLFDRG